MKNIVVEVTEQASIADFDKEPMLYVQRYLAGSTKVVAQAKRVAVALEKRPEGDGLFQRFMGFITGRAKFDPKKVQPIWDAPLPLVARAYAPTLTPVSSLLRLSFGQDYEVPCIKSPKMQRCLYELMMAPNGIGISREHLDAVVGTTNSPAYVDTLRNKKLARFGDVIKSEKRRVVVNGKKKLVGYYWMTSNGHLVARDILAHAGYMYDASSIERKGRQQQEDFRRLIVMFGNEHVVRSEVLDKTKPHAERLLTLLMWKGGWMSRYDIELLTGIPNPPDVVKAINDDCGAGFIQCERRTKIDRDGNRCYPGYYRIVPDWRPAIDALVHAA